MVRPARSARRAVRQDLRGAVGQGNRRSNYRASPDELVSPLTQSTFQITSRFDGVIKKLHYEADEVAKVGKVRTIVSG